MNRSFTMVLLAPLALAFAPAHAAGGWKTPEQIEAQKTPVKREIQRPLRRPVQAIPQEPVEDPQLDFAELPPEKPEAKMVKKPARKCRQPDEPYGLDEYKIPLCAPVAAAASPGTRQAVKPGWRTPASQTAAVDAAGFSAPEKMQPPAPPPDAPAVNFESYMQMNSGHPALSGKIANRQQAFQEVSKPAVIALPTSAPEPAAPVQAAPASVNPAPVPGAAPTAPAPPADTGFQY